MIGLHLKKTERKIWGRNLHRRTDWRDLKALPLGYRVAKILGRTTPAMFRTGGTWLMRIGTPR